jgi:hypothetical protein
MTEPDERLQTVSSANNRKMKVRPLEIVLLLIVVVGGGLAWQTGWERARLTRERDRLAKLTGDMTITDPAMLHIRAIETGTPLDFAWRIYVPPNFQLIRTENAGVKGSSRSSAANDFVARVRFRRDDQGFLQVFTRFANGNTHGKIGDESLATLLQDRWDEIRVEQLGTTGTVRMTAGESAVLLRLSLPDDIRAEARRKLTPGDQARFVPMLYALQLGPDPPPENAAESER